MLICQWFAMCENEATLAARGPVGDGAWDYIPVCQRCTDILKLDTLPIEITEG